MVICSSGNWLYLLQVSLENGPLPTQVSSILEEQDHVFIWKFHTVFEEKD